MEHKISPAQWLALSFFTVIMAGSLLLFLPGASANGHTSYIDCLFVATSATCVTGLVTVDTATNWTLGGQIIILLLIQVGGLGVMAFAVVFAMLLGQKIQLRQLHHRILDCKSTDNQCSTAHDAANRHK